METCKHLNTRSVNEYGGAILFRCIDCDMVRGAHPMSWHTMVAEKADAFGFAVLKHLGPTALAGDTVSPYDAFKMGWDAHAAEPLEEVSGEMMKALARSCGIWFEPLDVVPTTAKYLRGLGEFARALLNSVSRLPAEPTDALLEAIMGEPWAYCGNGMRDSAQRRYQELLRIAKGGKSPYPPFKPRAPFYPDGRCEREGGCVCGGDLPAIRATCPCWRADGVL